MTTSEYRSTILLALSPQATPNEDILSAARQIFHYLGTPFPQGSISDAMNLLDAGNCMGWNACDSASAQIYANNGYTTIGISYNNIVIILPDDSAVTLDTIVPGVTHPVARKLNEIRETERCSLKFFTYGVLVKSHALSHIDIREEILADSAVMASVSSANVTVCQIYDACQDSSESICQTNCELMCQTCNACQDSSESICQTNCELMCQTCNACQDSCESICQTSCELTCQTCNTCQDSCESICQASCELTCQTCEVNLEAHNSIDDLLDKFEIAPYIPDANKDSLQKRSTLLDIGRAMASWDMFHPTFIIGMLGHITSEGNIGLFEKVNNLDYMNNTLNAYPNYATDYSFKYIYENGISVSDVKDMVEYLNSISRAGFGLGCCQWTFTRTENLINVYYNIAQSTVTYEQAKNAEIQHLRNELTSSTYSQVYNYWLNSWSNRNYDSAAVQYWETEEHIVTFNENLDSPDAAYWAGRCIVVGLGGHPNSLDNPTAYINQGLPTQRGRNAKLLYEYLTSR